MRFFTYRLISVIFIAFSIILIFSMIYLCSEAHMASDDHVFGADTHATFLKTGSLVETIKEAFCITKWWYNNWQGSYVSMFLMILQPGIFSIVAYRVGLVLIFLILIIAPIVLGIIINKYYLRMKKWHTILILCIILFLWMQYMPSPFEGLYWYNSAIYYTFTYAVFLFSVTLIILMHNNKTISSNVLYFLLLLVCLVLIGGSNYPIALTSAIIFICYVIYSIIAKNKNRWLYLAGLLIFLIAFFFNIFSPGNLLRMGNYEWLGLFRIVYICIGEFLKECFNWTFNTPTLAFMIAGIAFLPARLKNTRLKFINPLIMLIILGLILLSQYFPPVYAMGSKGPLRAQNIRFMMFVTYVTIFTVNFCGWIQTKKIYKHFSSQIAKVVVIVIAGVMISVSLLSTPVSKLWGYKAINYVLSGDIERFDTEMMKRIAGLELNGEYEINFNQEYCINDMLRPSEDMWWNEVDEFYRGEGFVKYDKK